MRFFQKKKSIYNHSGYPPYCQPVFSFLETAVLSSDSLHKPVPPELAGSHVDRSPDDGRPADGQIVRRQTPVARIARIEYPVARHMNNPRHICHVLQIRQGIHICNMKIKITLYCPKCQGAKIKKNGRKSYGKQFFFAGNVDINLSATMH